MIDYRRARRRRRRHSDLAVRLLLAAVPLVDALALAAHEVRRARPPATSAPGASLSVKCSASPERPTHAPRGRKERGVGLGCLRPSSSPVAAPGPRQRPTRWPTP
jgi:hypothetical protein